MVDWLGGPPDQACAPQTARAMAMAAFLRARRLEPEYGSVAGVACTAGLATDRPKQGSHRAHVAFQTASTTATRSLVLQKGRRSRAEEERLVARLLLNTLAEAAEMNAALDLDLSEHEEIERSTVTAPRPWQDLLLGRCDAVPHGGPAPAAEVDAPRAILPGAFNPVHVGHRRMMEIGEEVLGSAVEAEISILNVDKPPLDYHELDWRTGQFDPASVIWLTRLATFEEKSRRFPKATFLVGVDTLERIADARYYGNDPSACRAALGRIARRGCRFLVFGRSGDTRFVGLADLDLPHELASICREVPARRFREDVSSTDIRRRQT